MFFNVGDTVVVSDEDCWGDQIIVRNLFKGYTGVVREVFKERELSIRVEWVDKKTYKIEYFSVAELKLHKRLTKEELLG